MHRPDEDRPERMLQFELRNGPAIEPKLVDKVNGRWIELDRRGERLVRKSLGEKLDAERIRKRDVILQILFEEARQGRVYTASQFAEAFENKAGLGGNATIRERLSVLATKGFVKFFRNHQEYGLPPAARFTLRLPVRRGHGAGRGRAERRSRHRRGDRDRTAAGAADPLQMPADRRRRSPSRTLPYGFISMTRNKRMAR